MTNPFRHTDHSVDGFNCTECLERLAWNKGHAAATAELSTLRTLTETQAREIAEAKAKLAMYERATYVGFDRFYARAYDNEWRLFGMHGLDGGAGLPIGWGLTRDEAIAKAAALAAEKKT